MIFADRVQAGIETFRRLTAANPKNVYPANLLGKARVFPHAAMYRRAIVETLDARALDVLAEAPPIDVLVARPPALPAPAALLAGYVSYLLERRVHARVHPQWPRAIGFRGELYTMQQHAAAAPAAERADAIADLVLASSCTPPFTPIYRFGSRLSLDGGLVDNVPIFAVPEHCERTLVLLTRRYPPEKLHSGSQHAGEHVVAQPSEPIPVVKWDYTSPDKLAATFELGLRDGERFAKHETQSASWTSRRRA